jgi:ABC-type antimicrobial peptide transport system permease subunit
MKRIMIGVVVFALLSISTLGWSQIKVSTVTDESTSSSKAVTTDLRSKISSHPKQFTLVSNKDSDAGIVITADCMPQKQKADPFVCFYTSHYAGATSKTFMGGGIYAATTSDEMADNFLASIAQDIVERWNKMIRSNAIESLESCLFLTQSSCKVPEMLVPELKIKVINLSQYLQKGGLRK